MEEHEIKLLCLKFSAPEMVDHWLGNLHEFETEHEYKIHEIICNLHPEDALLCITLCLKLILQKNRAAQNILKSITPLLTDILENYGHDALERLNIEIPNEARSDIEFVARDLTLLAAALEDVETAFLEMDYSALNIIISGLSVQAGAQAEIARYVMANFREQERRGKAFNAQDIPLYKMPPVNDNQRA